MDLIEFEKWLKTLKGFKFITVGGIIFYFNEENDIGLNNIDRNTFLFKLSSNVPEGVIVRHPLPFKSHVKTNKKGKKSDIYFENVFGFLFLKGKFNSIPKETLKEHFSHDAETGEERELRKEDIFCDIY